MLVRNKTSFIVVLITANYDSQRNTRLLLDFILPPSEAILEFSGNIRFPGFLNDVSALKIHQRTLRGRSLKVKG
jgi:hypothetical protein